MKKRAMIVYLAVLAVYIVSLCDIQAQEKTDKYGYVVGVDDTDESEQNSGTQEVQTATTESYNSTSPNNVDVEFSHSSSNTQTRNFKSQTSSGGITINNNVNVHLNIKIINLIVSRQTGQTYREIIYPNGVSNYEYLGYYNSRMNYSSVRGTPCYNPRPQQNLCVGPRYKTQQNQFQQVQQNVIAETKPHNQIYYGAVPGNSIYGNSHGNTVVSNGQGNAVFGNGNPHPGVQGNGGPGKGIFIGKR
ncbi:MAG: hypothetical protein V4504_02390 [Patescibacteria group bacterium]